MCGTFFDIFETVRILKQVHVMKEQVTEENSLKNFLKNLTLMYSL